ncbi:MAG: hypothetical protein GOV02_00600 [Candidatus Aenigmarchaeota archaeon]|nr:hypothetical protein [Candidatus Aenigmarchaeota archaeon]
MNGENCSCKDPCVDCPKNYADELIQNYTEIERKIINYLLDLNGHSVFPTGAEIYNEAFGLKLDNHDIKYVTDVLYDMEKRKQIEKFENGYKLNGVIHKMCLE